MTGDIKSKVQELDPNIKNLDIDKLQSITGNLYEALAIISKRAVTLSAEIKQELNQKLGEFSVTSNIIEEVSENREQIEISRFYERLPNPVVIALDEFMNGELVYRYPDKKED